MAGSGFFFIRIDEPRQPRASQELETGTEQGSDRRPPGQGSYLRLEWLDGKPHVTPLGGVHEVRRNDVTIPRGVSIALQAGDTITIGQAQLVWRESGDQEAQVRLEQAAGAIESGESGYRMLIDSPQGSKEISLTDSEIRVGRAPDNDIYIDDEHVSRYHAQLVRRVQGYEIVDLGSANGLRYQDKPVDRRMLVDGDVVWLSSGVSLTYRAVESASSGASATQVKDRPPRVELADEAPVIQRDAPDPAGTDQTVVRPARDTPDDATVVMPKPEGPPARDTPTDETVVAAAKAFDGPQLSQEEPVGGETADGTAEDLATDQTIVAPKKSEPAVEPMDATVVRPAVTIPQEPAREQVVGPELEGAKALSAGTMQETAMVDMAQYIQDTGIAAVSGTIIRDTQIPHLVVHLPTRTWEVQFSEGRMTVGRDVNSDVHIPDESVSRHHATIERHGDDFVIREAQSRNGLWLNQQRIEERTLRDGDVISVGRAKLMFKGGFASDDLTLVGRPGGEGRPARRPVVFVPGLGGSELWLGSERLWPNPKILISNPEVYQLPGDPRIEARRIVSDVVIVPNIIKQQQYSRLGDYLETGLGYKRGRDLLEFAYDWRQDIRLASQRLAETVEGWGVEPPVTIIAHSLGTLVTRYYVERLGGKKVVDRLVLLGGPHYGTPGGLAAILIGPGILPFGMGDERLRHVLASFPSAYQILPVYHCVTDQNDATIDPLHDESWLPERQRPFLRAARSFRNELGVRSSVPSVSIFGYGLKTILRVKIHRRSDGQWERVEFIEDTAGDLSVPSGSAVLKRSEIHPVLQEHGSLYVDDDVKMRLKVELTRSTTWERGK